MNKREFCPQCRVLLDDERTCLECRCSLVDIDMSDLELWQLVELGILTPFSSGEFDLTEKGAQAIKTYIKGVEDGQKEQS